MRKIFVALTVLALSGCTTTVRLQPVAGVDQQEIFIDGVPVLVSTKASTVKVRRSDAPYDSRARLAFSISVTNTTTTAFIVGSESVTVQMAGKPVKVFGYDELVKETNDNAKNEALSKAITGTFSANAAASQAGTTHHNAAVYGKNGESANVYGTSYNAGAAQQARNAEDAKTQAEIAAIQRNAEKSLIYYSTRILKKNTLTPGATATGDVLTAPMQLSEKATEGDVDLTVSTGNETHQFKFILRKLK